MRKIWIIAIAAAAATLAGCNREIDSPVAGAEDGLFRATIETPSRVAFSDEGVFTWQTGDAVAVLTDAGIKNLTLTGVAGYPMAAFEGDLTGVTSATAAVYPAAIAKDATTVTLPEIYTWKEGQSNAAMYCEQASLTTVNTFKHLGGIIKIAYKEIPANANALVFKANARITGDFTIENGAIATPISRSESEAAEGGTVTIKFTAGSNPAAFYIPVPVGEYLFTAELLSGDVTLKGTSKSTSKGIVVARRNLVLMDAVEQEEPFRVTITTAEEFTQFLADAPSFRDKDEAVLGNDIDLAGIDITPAKQFGGVFDGAGKTLKNMTVPNALFANLSGTVKNLKIENGAINFNGRFPDMTGIALVASKATGNILDCDVNGNVKVVSDGINADKDTENARIYCAGIVGEMTTGLVQGCKFSGSIDVELTSKSRSISSIGGVVSRAGQNGQHGKVIVKDCVNEASIKFTFSGAAKAMAKFGIGGVVGQTPSKSSAAGNDNFDCGVIENVVNYGDIEWSYPAGGSGSYPCLGGVVGAVEGELHGAENHGKVTYTGSKTTAATDASIGGVAGYVTGNASDCHNYGTITLDAGFAGGTSLAQNGGNTSFSTFGGVFGNVGQFVADNALNNTTPVLVENISNEAEIILTPKMVQTGGPRMCIAGVIGASTANLKNIVNNKPVTIQTQTKFVYASGVVGYSSGDMENCVNNAPVIYDGLKEEVPATKTNYQQVWLAGVVAYVIKGCQVLHCENHGDLTLNNVYTTATALSYMGGINAAYQGGFQMIECVNDAVVVDNAETPICLGGLSGAFNGQMTDCVNSGTVNYATNYMSATAGKEPEVGGLIGYANASFSGCENTGAVIAGNGFAGGLVGSAGKSTSAALLWKGSSANCTVTGDATKGAVVGRFRENGPTTLNLGEENEPILVSDQLDALPICAAPGENNVNEVNVIRGKIEVAPKADKTEILAGETVKFSISPVAEDVIWSWKEGDKDMQTSGRNAEAVIEVAYPCENNDVQNVPVSVSARINGELKNWTIELKVKPYAIFDRDFPKAGNFQGFYGMAPIFSPDGKKVYIVTSQNAASAVAYSTETFERLWITAIPGSSPRNQNTCAVNPVTGDLYVPTSNTKALVAITADGAEKWVCTLPDNVNQRANPAIKKDGSVVFIGAGGHLVAVKAEDGTILWDVVMPSGVNAITVNGNEVIVGCGVAAKGINFVNVETGEVTATIDLPAAAPNNAEIKGIAAMTTFAAAADGKTVYVGGAGTNNANNGMVYMIDIEAHELLKSIWLDGPNENGSNSTYEPVISPVNGDVFFGNKNSSVYCFSKDLELKWVYSHLTVNNAFNYSHPCVDADGNFMISAGQANPCTYVFSPDGEILKKYAYTSNADESRSMAGNNYLNGILYTLGYGAKDGHDAYFIAKYVGGKNPTGSWVRSGGDLCGSNCIK